MKALALSVLLALLGMALVGRAATAAETYTDPFAYCAAVRTIDAPDARYTGAKMPESIARGLQKAFHAPASAPLGPFLENSVWRCMDGKVYACNVGANIPCQEKADTSRKPTAVLKEFCEGNRDAAVIPAYVTGRATVYEWRCKGTAPTAVRQLTRPDARGYLASAWYQISPSR
jgi:hypothetical protein